MCSSHSELPPQAHSQQSLSPPSTHSQQSLSPPGGQEPAAGTAASQGLTRKPSSPQTSCSREGTEPAGAQHPTVRGFLQRLAVTSPRRPCQPFAADGEATQRNLIRLDSCFCSLGQQRTRSVQISTTKPWQAQGQRLRDTRRHFLSVCPTATAQSKQRQRRGEDLVQSHLLGSGWPSSDKHKPVSAHRKGEKC